MHPVYYGISSVVYVLQFAYIIILSVEYIILCETIYISF